MPHTTKSDLIVVVLLTRDDKVVLLRRGSSFTLPTIDHCRSLESDIIMLMSRYFEGISLSIDGGQIEVPDFVLENECCGCTLVICRFKGRLRHDAQRAISVLDPDQIPSHAIDEDMRPILSHESLKARLS